MHCRVEPDVTQTLDILERLIGFESVSHNSNLDIIDYIDDFLRARGFSVHRVPSSDGAKAGLFAVLGPINLAGILLSAHTDVVPVAGQSWTTDPFRLTCKHDRAYGRGTTDMKGYVASVLSLADRASSVPLSEPLKIAFSYDEEVGCVGIQHMIGRLKETIGLPRACIVGEPTQMQVAIGHKGKAALRANCIGQSGHSALAPNFVNALHLAGDFMAGARALQDELATKGARDSAYAIPYSTIHVGTLHGGIALNVVPNSAELTIEFRHLAADAATDLLAQIESIADTAAAPFRQQFPEARIDIEQYNAYPGLDVSASAQVVSLVQGFAQSNTPIKVAFGTEAGVFDQLGVPSVVCGPGSMEGQGHKPDEYIELSELLACDAMMDRVLDQLKM